MQWRTETDISQDMLTRIVDMNVKQRVKKARVSCSSTTKSTKNNFKPEVPFHQQKVYSTQIPRDSNGNDNMKSTQE